MNYLQVTEYEQFGLEAATDVAWVTAASSVMDAHCRRSTLGVAQFQERLRIMGGRNTVRVTYLPLAVVAPATTSVVSARGRYTMPRRGEWVFSEMTSEIAYAFGLPGTWTNLNAADLEACAESGEITLPVNALGLGFSEIELIYMAGLDPLPNVVKAACAQLVKNAQATPALNVKMGRLDRMRMDYFSDTLVDASVRSMLAPFVAQKVG